MSRPHSAVRAFRVVAAAESAAERTPLDSPGISIYLSIMGERSKCQMSEGEEGRGG